MSLDLIYKGFLNVVYIFAVYIVFSGILGKAKYNKIITFFSYLFFYLVLTYIYLFLNNQILSFTCNILGFFALSFLYESNLSKKIFTTFFVLSSFIVIETLFMYLISNSYLARFSADFISLLFSFCVSYFMRKKNRDFIPKKYYRYITIFNVFNIAIIMLILLYFLQQKEKNYFFPLIIFILLIMNIIFYIVFNDMIGSFEREQNLSNIKNQYDLIKAQTDNIHQSTLELKKLEHDLKNKLTPIAYLVKEEKLDELNEYFNNILEDFSKLSVFKESGILELDGILNSKYKLGKSLGIEFESYISISDQLTIDCMDLAVIMGNLLDNAIEAASKVSYKWIKFSIKEVRGVLFLSVENSFDGFLKIKNNEISTRKNDKSNHGYGLKSVKAIVEKYDGDLDITYNHSSFKVRIILYDIY